MDPGGVHTPCDPLHHQTLSLAAAITLGKENLFPRGGSAINTLEGIVQHLSVRNGASESDRGQQLEQKTWLTSV